MGFSFLVSSLLKGVPPTLSGAETLMDGPVSCKSYRLGYDYRGLISGGRFKMIQEAVFHAKEGLQTRRD